MAIQIIFHHLFIYQIMNLNNNFDLIVALTYRPLIVDAVAKQLIHYNRATKQAVTQNVTHQYTIIVIVHSPMVVCGVFA